MPDAKRSQSATCEAVGYFEKAELRTALIIAKSVCPFQRAADLEPLRMSPVVQTWKMLRDGRLSVERTDVQGHVEEWDVFVVTEPFTEQAVQFAIGDLVQYLRREKNNENNASFEFNHLRKLQ
jgi:hypothetical protein